MSSKLRVAAIHPLSVDLVSHSVREKAEVVTLRDLEAVVQRDTAGATITFSLCQQRPTRWLSANAGPERICTRVDELDQVAGVRVALNGDAAQTLVMTVTPERAGTVVIDGVEASYTRDAHHLWRHESVTVGPQVAITVRR